MADDRKFEIDELLVRPGTYFNPQTEVLVMVDDSTSLESEIFNMEEFEGADWVLIADELPVDEAKRDELLEDFQTERPRRRRRARHHRRGPGRRGRRSRRGRRTAARGRSRRRRGVAPVGCAVRPIYGLGIFIPVAVGLELAHASPTLIFLAAALGVIPTAALMGESTEHLAAKTGPGLGGLLNVTFGNAPELIIAFFALNEGLQEVVKASIVGSIIGNILLVLGAAMLVGGLKRDKQTFNRTAATAQAGMLLLALTALILPAVFQLVHGGGLPAVSEERVDFGTDLEHLSLGVAIVLMVSYVAGLFFSQRTHKAVFNPYDEKDEEAEHGAALVDEALADLAGRGRRARRA